MEDFPMVIGEEDTSSVSRVTPDDSGSIYIEQ